MIFPLFVQLFSVVSFINGVIPEIRHFFDSIFLTIIFALFSIFSITVSVGSFNIIPGICIEVIKLTSKN